MGLKGRSRSTPPTLFDDFPGYVSFLLLDDLVNDDISVTFFMPFDDFDPPWVPKDVGAYKEYPPLLDRVHQSQEPPD
jgi:hypothetical protein